MYTVQCTSLYIYCTTWGLNTLLYKVLFYLLYKVQFLIIYTGYTVRLCVLSCVSGARTWSTTTRRCTCASATVTCATLPRPQGVWHFCPSYFLSSFSSRDDLSACDILSFFLNRNSFVSGFLNVIGLLKLWPTVGVFKDMTKLRALLLY
jgi:hypothetical protein